MDPLTSYRYCGATGDCKGASSGHTCAAGEVCSAGTCAASCPAELVQCDGRCVDAQNNPLYCGASGNCQGLNAGSECQGAEICRQGHCVVP